MMARVSVRVRVRFRVRPRVGLGLGLGLGLGFGLGLGLRIGTWHVDQVGVKAPGSETISTLPLEVSDSIGRFSLKLTWRRRGWRR